MACFYCARKEVNSADAGPCNQCLKNVCTEGLSARPNRHHGDTCACGCGELLCIYHMRHHAQTVHRSTIQTCFANTALLVSLVAAASTEDLAGAAPSSRRTEGALDDLREFMAVIQPDEDEVLGGAQPGGTIGTEWQFVPAQPGLYYFDVLTGVVPAVVRSIRESWKHLPSDRRSRYSGELPRRLDALVQADADILGSPFNGDALRSYGTLSPRLHRLMRDTIVREGQAAPRFSFDGSAFRGRVALGGMEDFSRRLQRTTRGAELRDFLKGKL